MSDSNRHQQQSQQWDPYIQIVRSSTCTKQHLTECWVPALAEQKGWFTERYRAACRCASDAECWERWREGRQHHADEAVSDEYEHVPEVFTCIEFIIICEPSQSDIYDDHYSRHICKVDGSNHVECNCHHEWHWALLFIYPLYRCDQQREEICIDEMLTLAQGKSDKARCEDIQHGACEILLPVKAHLMAHDHECKSAKIHPQESSESEPELNISDREHRSDNWTRINEVLQRFIKPRSFIPEVEPVTGKNTVQLVLQFKQPERALLVRIVELHEVPVRQYKHSKYPCCKHAEQQRIQKKHFKSRIYSSFIWFQTMLGHCYPFSLALFWLRASWDRLSDVRIP